MTDPADKTPDPSEAPKSWQPATFTAVVILSATLVAALMALAWRAVSSGLKDPP